MTKLSKYEKETIINWNEAEDTASIYTFNADLKRRLAEFSRKYRGRSIRSMRISKRIWTML